MTSSKKISAIFRDEHQLEIAINALKQETVPLHDISIQANPSEFLDRLGTSYVSPEKVQAMHNAPKEEPYLKDDFGWVMGFSFSIPMFIGLVVGVFLVGDISSLADNIIFGILGALIGGAIGFVLSRSIKKLHDKDIKNQENKGGYVVWITSRDEEQEQKIIALLKEHNAVNIKTE